MVHDSNDMRARMNEMYKYAIATGKASSKSDFAELAGVTQETMSRFFSGVREPSKKTLAAINRELGMPFKDEWLLLGTGAMLVQQTQAAVAQQPSDIQLLVTEMRESRIEKDKQIDRLLTIIENMQAK